MQQTIYLDYSATTPIDKVVADAMLPWITTTFGNAASNTHGFGIQAKNSVENARQQIAKLVNADTREIIFTSGATESNNLALKGTALGLKQKGNHIITLKTEHKSILDTCKYLESIGFEITYLDVDKNGLLDIELLKNSLRSETILVSVMHVNNEIGVIQNIQAIGQLCQANNIIFHVDAAQSAGKLPIDLKALPVNLMSFSAHKVYGPQGIGALYISRKPRQKLAPIIHGGGHENGYRSGTLAVHQIVGMGTAFELANKRLEQDYKHIKKLHLQLLQGLSNIEQSYINGDINQRVPHNLNISFNHIDGEALMMGLTKLALSSGSACTSASVQASHVLLALGLDINLAYASLRISIGRYTTAEQITKTINYIKEEVLRLRNLSPFWQSNAALISESHKNDVLNVSGETYATA